MQKYEEFKNIKLEDTDLFNMDQDWALICLHANNIYTLQDLLNLQISNIKLYPVYSDQISGLIKLAKYKYLKEDLSFFKLLNGQVVVNSKDGQLYLDTQTSKRLLTRCLVDMGFDIGLVRRIQFELKYDCKLIESLDSIKQISFQCFNEKYSTMEKINIIEYWYQENVEKKYKEVCKKYESLQDIKLGNTGLIRTNHLDLVYNCLRKNEIFNLQEVFAKDDLDMIEYNTTKGYTKLNKPINQTKGTIALLRHKYLNEGLPFIEILNNKIHNGYFMVNGICEENALIDNLTSLGLPYEFCFSLDKRARELNNFGFSGKLIDFLEYYYVSRNARMYCNQKEYDNAISKLDIILDWYRSLDPTYKEIDTEEEARSMLLSLYQKLNELKIKEKEINVEIVKTEKDISYTDAVLTRLRKK